MGYGLRENVQRLGCKVAEKTGRKRPFKDGKAGRGWFDGFKVHLSVPHNLLRLPGLFQRMNMWFLIFLQNSGAFMAG